jgi:hypothetical protein
MARLFYQMDLPHPRDRVWAAISTDKGLSFSGETVFADPPRLLQIGGDDNAAEATAQLFPTLDGTRLEVTVSVDCDGPTQERLDREWQTGLEEMRGKL